MSARNTLENKRTRREQREEKKRQRQELEDSVRRVYKNLLNEKVQAL